MGSDWHKFKLGDLGSFRNGANFSKKDYAPGFPIVNVKQLYAHRYVETDNLLEVSSKAISNPESLFLKNGDILFARSSVKGSGAGQAAMISSCPENTIFSGFIIRFRIEARDIALPLFVNYLLRSDIYRELLPRIASGTTITNLSQGTLASLPILLPPLPEQRAIAHILGSLDDKIELNHRMNHTLEAMAKAIFKSWFVDFDPVRAKAEGRPTGLPDDIAALFPDSFENSEIGEIPKGWEVKPIGQVVKCVGGSTPSTKNPAFWAGGKNPFVTPKDMSSLTSPVILDTSRYITDAGVAKISSGRLPSGTVILSSRAPIGYLAITEVTVSVNQGVIAMICNKDLPNHYVLYWTETNMETIKSNASGTTFAEISKRNFRPMPVAVPVKPVLDAFVQQVEPLHRQLVLNLQESATLARLRDTFLPKLISGELRIPDSAKFLEEAGL
ncbi:restriction endonuclease subunit S [uncultured Mesotoga sp.]|uniref:restriction endonuclease subunit S n=1 Tax=uncultured Mesotoga sp. TaxID=1184400 RepID=UPI0002C8AFE4